MELLEQTGPAIIVAHSSAGRLGFNAARLEPEIVKAVVALEPLGCPDEEDDEYFTDAVRPFLGVYADYIEERRQTNRLAACRETARITTEQGSQGDMLEMREWGIFGNSHLMMQDSNSADIAGRVIDWLKHLHLR